jgi:hypothetical protein
MIMKLKTEARAQRGCRASEKKMMFPRDVADGHCDMVRGGMFDCVVLNNMKHLMTM